MSPAKKRWACAAASLFCALLVVVPSLQVRGWHASALVGIAEGDPVASVVKTIDPSFSFAVAHYDGTYFYTIAIDPFARGTGHSLLDAPAYRYGHPGYGWLSRVVSFGNDRWLPVAMLLIGIASLFAATYTAALLSERLGWSPWWGLLVALNPGLLFGLIADCSEPLGAFVLLLGLYMWMRRRTLPAGLLFIALCLIKEQFVLVPLALGAWELGQMWLQARPLDRPKRETIPSAVALVAGPLALAVWMIYLHGVFHVWSFTQQPLSLPVFTLPFLGLWDSLRGAAELRFLGGWEAETGTVSIVLLAAAFTAMLAGVIRAIRMRWEFDPVYIALAMVVFCLTPVALQNPKDFIRVASAQLLLLPLALAGPKSEEGLPLAPSVPDPIGGR